MRRDPAGLTSIETIELVHRLEDQLIELCFYDPAEEAQAALVAEVVRLSDEIVDSAEAAKVLRVLERRRQVTAFMAVGIEARLKMLAERHSAN